MHAVRKMLAVLADSDSTYSSCRWNPGRLGICQVERDGLATSRVLSRLAAGFGISITVDAVKSIFARNFAS